MIGQYNYEYNIECVTVNVRVICITMKVCDNECMWQWMYVTMNVCDNECMWQRMCVRINVCDKVIYVTSDGSFTDILI
jgi:hypothetical protein